jgi:hypothetical protein
MANIAPIKFLLFIGSNNYVVFTNIRRPWLDNIFIVDFRDLGLQDQIQVAYLSAGFYQLVVVGHNNVVLPPEVDNHFEIKRLSDRTTKFYNLFSGGPGYKL